MYSSSSLFALDIILKLFLSRLKNTKLGFISSKLNTSCFSFSKAVIALSEEMLGRLQEYEDSQAATIGKFLKTSIKLGAKYTASKNLTTEENSLLSERQKYLFGRLKIGTDAAKGQIILIKKQAERFFARLAEINRDETSLEELADLEQEARPSFGFLAENMAQIVLDAQNKVEFFVRNEKLITTIITENEKWREDYKTFRSKLREELSGICHEEGIEGEKFSLWYEDWAKKRFKIEQRLLPLLEFCLSGNLTEKIADIVKILGEYRDSIDKFYLQERIKFPLTRQQLKIRKL